ncbi:ATP-binding protein [Georgenia sp. SUBG003]|uniref:ATP-binding protein n=1 Tax=Georgenia sp. SUBG003 TaxID=1497974 RepID=UPI0006932BC1
MGGAAGPDPPRAGRERTSCRRTERETGRQRRPRPCDPRPGAAGAVGRWQIRSADDLPLLRQATLAVALRAGVGGSGLDPVHSRLALVATELATNALKYGTGPCVVSIFRAGSGWLLDVGDGSPDSPPVRYPPEPGRPGRNGLLIIEQLSTRWGWYPAQDGARKHVWAELAD